jgi:hypothetical protein
MDLIPIHTTSYLTVVIYFLKKACTKAPFYTRMAAVSEVSGSKVTFPHTNASDVELLSSPQTAPF